MRGWRLSRSGKASTARATLEYALITGFGGLGQVATRFLLRGNNGQVFTSRKYVALVGRRGLRRELITPHCWQRNGMSERLIRSLQEQRAHRQHVARLSHVNRAIGGSIPSPIDARTGGWTR
ncbi:MAG: hypothetical protein AAF501_20115 [Pseudomonadota bacterium]